MESNETTKREKVRVEHERKKMKANKCSKRHREKPYETEEIKDFQRMFLCFKSAPYLFEVCSFGWLFSFVVVIFGFVLSLMQRTPAKRKRKEKGKWAHTLIPVPLHQLSNNISNKSFFDGSDLSHLTKTYGKKSKWNRKGERKHELLIVAVIWIYNIWFMSRSLFMHQQLLIHLII